jgi:hypothetical protein
MASSNAQRDRRDDLLFVSAGGRWGRAVEGWRERQVAARCIVAADGFFDFGQMNLHVSECASTRFAVVVNCFFRRHIVDIGAGGLFDCEY